MTTKPPVPAPTLPDVVEVPARTRRPGLLLAAAAGLCWASALALLVSGGLEAEHTFLTTARIIFYLLTLVAGLLTFVPMQRQLSLPGLVREGVAGTFLLLYVLAFVPPPSAWLLAPPETPVYLIFMAALFWSVSAAIMPLVYTLGQRAFRQRARQYDRRRARRQAHEVGLLIALCAGLAGLRALTLIGVLLLALILVVAELLFLSFVEVVSSQ